MKTKPQIILIISILSLALATGSLRWRQRSTDRHRRRGGSRSHQHPGGSSNRHACTKTNRNPCAATDRYTYPRTH